MNVSAYKWFGANQILWHSHSKSCYTDRSTADIMRVSKYPVAISGAIQHFGWIQNRTVKNSRISGTSLLENSGDLVSYEASTENMPMKEKWRILISERRRTVREMKRTWHRWPLQWKWHSSNQLLPPRSHASQPTSTASIQKFTTLQWPVASITLQPYTQFLYPF